MPPGFFTSGKLLVLLCLALIPVQGDSIDLVDTTPGRLNAMQLEMEYFEDRDSTLLISDILDGAADFRPIEQAVPSFGFSKSTYWFKVLLNIPEHVDDNWHLEVSYPLLDSIDYYLTSNDKIIDTVRTGDSYSFWQRSIEDRTFIFPLEYDRSQNQLAAFLRINTSSSFVSLRQTRAHNRIRWSMSGRRIFV